MTDLQSSNSIANVSGGVNVNAQGDSSIQGDVVGRDKIVNISVQAAYAEGRILCPVDSHGDTIQKVSAIVSGTSGSLLAQKLALPQPPAMPGVGCEVMTILIALGLAFSIGLAFFNRTDALGSIGGIGTVVIFVIFYVRIVRSTRKKTQQDKVEFEKKRQQWPEIKNAWNKTYYCHKHDVVFIGGQTETATPDQFYSFLSNRANM